MDPHLTRRQLGQTGYHLPELSLGTADYATGVTFKESVDLLPASGHEEAVETLKEAVKSGINYIDTSPYYGGGKSEVVVGFALKQLERSSFIISTKCGRNSNATFDFSSSNIEKSVNKSLKTLGLDYIDLMIVHDVEFGSMDQIVNESIPTLVNLKEKGLVRAIGISGYSVQVLRDICERSNEVQFILSYCRSTLWDRNLDQHLPFFSEKKIGVINASVHGMGLLSGSDTLPVWHPSPPDIRVKCKEVRDYCTQVGEPVAKVALMDALNRMREHGRIHTILTGMRDRWVLAQNVKLLAQQMDPSIQNIIDHIHGTIMQGLVHPLDWEGAEVARYHKDPDAFASYFRNPY